MVVGPVEVEEAFADDSLEMNEAGDKFRVALELQDAIATHHTHHQDGGSDELDVTALSGELADPQKPKAHKASHQLGSADALNVGGLSGLLADPQTAGGIKTGTTIVNVSLSNAPFAGQTLVASSGTAATWGNPVPPSHAERHADGGADELVVTGLSGKLADAQTPLAHKASHQSGGADALSVAGLAGELSGAQKVSVLQGGSIVGTRPQVNLIAGVGITLSVADNPGQSRVDVTINGPPVALLDLGTNGFRLAPTADDSIPADGTFSTIYLAPFVSNLIALYYDFTWKLYATDGTSYALSGRTANLPFDVFAYWTGAAIALEVVNWASGTARATAIVQANGVWTKGGDGTRRYLGTVRPRSATTYRVQRNSLGSPSVGIDYWNVSNKRQAGVALLDTSGSHGYTNGAWQQWANSGNAQIEVVQGLAGDSVSINALGLANTSNTTTVRPATGIGVNSMVVLSGSSVSPSIARIAASPFDVAACVASLNATALLGITTYAWLEWGAAGVSFFGAIAPAQSGLSGTIWY